MKVDIYIFPGEPFRAKRRHVFHIFLNWWEIILEVSEFYALCQIQNKFDMTSRKYDTYFPLFSFLYIQLLSGKPSKDPSYLEGKISTKISCAYMIFKRMR